jgi:hypothetical protein
MEPVSLVVIIGVLTVVKAIFRCAEILVLARAYNMRESARRLTIMSVLTAIRADELTIHIGDPEAALLDSGQTDSAAVDGGAGV